MTFHEVGPEGIEQPTGRMKFCPSCRKPLPRPTKDQVILICSHCSTETSLPPTLSAVEQSSLPIRQTHWDYGASPESIRSTAAPTFAATETMLEEDDSLELTLEPEADRMVPTANVAPWPPSSLPSSAPDYASTNSIPLVSELEAEKRSEQVKHSYLQSSGLYPRERTYPTLEAMQRLYRIFGYLSVILAFPYIAIRFLYLLVTTKQNYLQVFAQFTEFAVPVLIGSVVITATLFAAAEGIRLAMDIQENTLRIANSYGRRKLD